MGVHLEQIAKPLTMTASGAITAAGLLLKVGSADNTAALASATSSVLVGVSLHSAADGAPVAVAGPLSIAMCKVGTGGSTRGVRQMFVTGAKITDGTGNVQTIGIALATGVIGDLIPVLIYPGTIESA